MEISFESVYMALNGLSFKCLHHPVSPIPSYVVSLVANSCMTPSPPSAL